MAEPAPLPKPEHWARLRRWLQPGIGVKRWLALYAAALTLVALGAGLLLTHLYRTAPFPEPVYYATLQFVPRAARGALLLLAGGALLALATWKLAATFVGLLLPHFPYRGRHPGRSGLGEALWAQRVLSRGPRVVAIGGGTGLSTLLRGLKAHTGNLTAVVTVCDDGGSSGRLRRDLRVLPPGDFRQCIAALADADPLVTALFEHRFPDGPPGPATPAGAAGAAGAAGGPAAPAGGRHDLAGHAFGNLFIAALAQITGSFERALEESSRVLAVRGRILPSSLA
ncbi:MAG TPA: gluconeogenesis factor YvcK family protein, partial [Chloroflexota bacterium]|nr:gluconeogenesis factor YvcK family protein [Chloroflexota bacterium]